MISLVPLILITNTSFHRNALRLIQQIFWGLIYHIKVILNFSWSSLGNLARNSAGNLVGNAVENLAGKAVGNLAGNAVENLAGKAVGNLAGNAVENLAGNAAGNLVGNSVGNLVGKYSLLKPILNGFSYMTHQIEA